MAMHDWLASRAPNLSLFRTRILAAVRTPIMASVLAIWAISCTPASETATAPLAEASAPARHAESGLPVVPLTVQSGGAVHRFAVEYASSQQEQARGLMFRSELGEGEGMIFPNDPPQQRSFWMKNTLLPLDIIFIGPDLRIESIAAETTPYSLDPIGSQGSVIAVLELRGGRAAELSIHPGDTVRWEPPAPTAP